MGFRTMVTINCCIEPKHLPSLALFHRVGVEANHGRNHNKVRTHPRLQCLARFFVSVLRASGTKTETVEHIAVPPSQRRMAHMAPSEDDVSYTQVSREVSCEWSYLEDEWLVQAPAPTKTVFRRGLPSQPHRSHRDDVRRTCVAVSRVCGGIEPGRTRLLHDRSGCGSLGA
jgi:hypothetical protein